jgi:hypothetical protein
MKPCSVLRHEFVEFIPDELEQGTLYISMRFATASHFCCCGCGNKVVTPIRPTDWKLIYDGKTVSLHPSIGNWSFPCRSHYWIKNNRVEWAAQWSREQIERGRSHDSFAKDAYFGTANATVEKTSKDDEGKPQAQVAKPRIWQVVKKWLS